MIKHILYIIIGICLSQSWFNHPELDWYTFETDHFIFHYHEETERSAREAAKVAENIYFNVTSYYEFEPDSKTHFIIKDVNDYSNGAAYFFDNKIEISALPLDFRLRGSHRWLQNVITHEFTHIIQIGASMKASNRFPLGFLQIIDYEMFCMGIPIKLFRIQFQMFQFHHGWQRERRNLCIQMQHMIFGIQIEI